MQNTIPFEQYAPLEEEEELEINSPLELDELVGK